MTDVERKEKLSDLGIALEILKPYIGDGSIGCGLAREIQRKIVEAIQKAEARGRGEVFMTNFPLRMALQKLRVGAVTSPDVKHFCELDKDEADAVRKEIEKLEPNYGD